MAKTKPKPKAPTPDTEQAAKLAAAFGAAPFTVAAAAPVLGLKGQAANLTAGRVLKKLADAGLIDRKPDNTYVAGAGEVNPPASARTREPDADEDDPRPDHVVDDPRPRKGVRKQIEPATPVKPMTRADRKALLDANLPEGVGLSAKTAEEGDTLE